MLKHSILWSIPFAVMQACVLAGCSGHVELSSPNALDEGPEVRTMYRGEVAPQSVIYPNSLEPAALLPSDLGIHPLSISTMSSATAALVTGPNGTLVRKLLKYAVGCALKADQNFDFDWTSMEGSVYHESYAGGIGLAPDWPTASLDTAKQEWVSACLAARTNWYGEMVQISMRGSLAELNPLTSELTTFTHREGAFWGNLFSSTPYLRACYDSANVSYSRDAHRDCAAGHTELGMVLECGLITIVGSCSQSCMSVSTNGSYVHCYGSTTSTLFNDWTDRAISVFLH